MSAADKARVRAVMDSGDAYVAAVATGTIASMRFRKACRAARRPLKAARSAPLTDTCVEGHRSHETVGVGAPAVYDKDGHKLRAEVGRNIAAGIFWAKTRYRSAPPSSTMSAAPPGGIKHDVKRIMRDEIPLPQHAPDLGHSRFEPVRGAQAAGQASIDANQPFPLLDTIAKAGSF